MDEAYFKRVEAIHYTIAHDDGVGWENWEAADIVLAGVSRSSKTPTSIYLANRGYKVANIPIVVESPPPPALFGLKHPLVVGLTTAPDRLVQVRRNRLLSLNQAPETAYVDNERVTREVARCKHTVQLVNSSALDASSLNVQRCFFATLCCCSRLCCGDARL